MKKLLPVFILAAAVMAFVFVGCAKEGEKITGGVPESFDGMVTLVLDSPATEGADVYFQVPYGDFGEQSTALELLQKLADDGKIFFEGEDSTYGFFLNAVGYVDGEERITLVHNGENYDPFISIYTSVEKDFGGLPMQYGDVTLETSAVGIGSMSLADGAVIFLTEASV